MEPETKPRVRIIGLRVAKRAADGNSQTGLSATFDAQIPFMTLFGCSLHRRRNGNMIACPPRGERNDGTATGIRIEDESLQEELTKAACEVAQLFGVNVAPWPTED